MGMAKERQGGVQGTGGDRLLNGSPACRVLLKEPPSKLRENKLTVASRGHGSRVLSEHYAVLSMRVWAF